MLSQKSKTSKLRGKKFQSVDEKVPISSRKNSKVQPKLSELHSKAVISSSRLLKPQCTNKEFENFKASLVKYHCARINSNDCSSPMGKLLIHSLLSVGDVVYFQRMYSYLQILKI